MHDIICLYETWCLDSNILLDCFDGYQLNYLNAQKFNKYGRAAGGVAVFIRNNYASRFKRIFNHFSLGINIRGLEKIFSIYLTQ